MKIKFGVETNLKTKEVKNKLNSASKKALKNTVVAIARDTIKESPWITGNNARSIMYEIGPGGLIAKGDLTGAIYSTSGYGGYLETGTSRMGPQPYFRPALDMNIHLLPEGIKAELR